MTETLDRFDYVLTMLANHLQRNKDGVVFLLGAGCSCQYGLPSFKQLLAYIWEDCYGKPPKDSSMEALRENLDKHWHTLGPQGRRDILHRSLRRVDGAQCPGYRRLARLCHPDRSLNVKAIVNMNFDSLLEDALDAEDVRHQVVASFAELEKGDKGELIVCKPHGSLKKVYKKVFTKWVEDVNSDLTLDIANSELFAGIQEQTSAQALLSSHDVVALGYSGVDSKIATSLRNMPGNFPKTEKTEKAEKAEKTQNVSSDDKKLFFINSTLPDPRLVLVMSDRASQELSISGEDAAFENFMEQLEGRILGAPSSNTDQALYRPSDQSENFTFMTRSERAALNNCLRLALRIRAAINVADRSEVSIEEHGTSVYRSCLSLAKESGVCLSPPEKYILYAVAFLHDLGYFAAYSDGTAIENGWQLLDGEHCNRTAELLDYWLPDRDESPDVVPGTYGSPREVVRIIKFICRFHAYYDSQEISKVIKRKKLTTPEARSTIKIGGCEVPIRVTLLQALFAAAEELAEAHPWAPSADTLLSKEEENRWAIEDPVLDLYLRRKRNVVSFKIERGLVTGSARPTGSKKADWLLAIVNEHIKYYEGVRAETYEKEGEGYREWKLSFRREPEVKQIERDDKGRDLLACLLCEALEEELKISLQEVRAVFSRDLELLRKNGEKGLRALCQYLAGAGLRESVMHLWMVQRALAPLSLPDLWYSELVHRLSQAKRDIAGLSKSADPESASGVYDRILLSVNPLLIAMDTDDGYGLVEDSDIEEANVRGKEALDAIKAKLGRSYRQIDDLDLLTKTIDEALDLLETQKASIEVALGKGARSLLLGAAEIVRSVSLKEGGNLPEEVKKELQGFSDQLFSLVSKLGFYFSGEIASVLDLIAIYTLSVSADPASRPDSDSPPRVEPRVSLANSQVVGGGLEAVEMAKRASQSFPHQGLLQIYLPLRHSRGEGKLNPNPVDMEEVFLKSFDEIIYPAWRFFARNWHHGIEPVLMARICLDLGSSRFRSEVVNGLKFLMRRVGPRGDYLCGHNGCTLCTSRLLYIFSYGCKLFPREDLEKIRIEDRKFDETVGKLLKFMIARDKEEPKGRSLKWKGSETSGPRSIQSSDYLAWAPRAVAFCLSVDEEIRNKTGESWLADKCGVGLEESQELLNTRFDHLFEEKSVDMLSRQGEEPHSFILGHVALTMLDLEILSKSSAYLMTVYDRVPQAFKENFIDAYQKLEGLNGGDNSEDRGGPALLSRLYAWPAGVLYGNYIRSDKEKYEENCRRLVRLCNECVWSEIWIKEGSDAGSWGYNIKNSQTIITSLAAFWRHAFDSEDREMYARLFKEELRAGSVP